MTPYSELSPSYAPLLTGDHGFIMSLAITMLAFIIITFSVKLYLTYCRVALLRNEISSATNALIVSDVLWLLAHVLALVYFGIRFSTLHGLVEESGSSSLSHKSRLARRNDTCEALFVLTIYVSSCSVLCTALAIPNVSAARNSNIFGPTYLAPFTLFLVGLVLVTFPRINCNPEYIFSGSQHLCPSSTARFLPAMIVIIVVDIALVIYWCMFIYTQTVGSSAGASSTRKQSWPIAPFVLRLLVASANIAYCAVHARYSRSETLYYFLFYAELLSIAISLTATSSVSLSRILGHLNFAGVAYNVEPSARSHTASGTGDLRLGGPSESATKSTIRARGRCSGESRDAILGTSDIIRTIDILVTKESSPSSSSRTQSRDGDA